MRTKSLYMMWNFILPIFLFAKACFGETDCSENPFELCPYPQLFSMIPKTASEYSKICPDLPNYIKCLRKFQKTCNSMVFFDSDEEYESLHEFYSELCEEGSLFNTIVIENLKCLNETLDSSHCSDETQTLIHEFKSVETANEDDDSEHLPVDIACL
ncbi:unnamed protein product [Larinioides sclopetarius]|uniref:DUF19 domain-containing protein n=1 Tax=Larinioides sclopetarius TaxID=280406 RepID=A0AAV2BLX8_9ARAC